MNSSIEEFGLLLRKWDTERTKLVAILRLLTFGNSAETLFMVSGLISEINEQTQIVKIGDEENSLAQICYGNCEFRYAPTEDDSAIKRLPEDHQAAFAPYGDCMAVLCAPNARVILMASKAE